MKFIRKIRVLLTLSIFCGPLAVIFTPMEYDLALLITIVNLLVIAGLGFLTPIAEQREKNIKDEEVSRWNAYIKFLKTNKINKL